MKILNAHQIKEADAHTIETEPIKSIDLMERAANACVYWILEHYDSSLRIAVLCGTGNNGGDGLAVTRLLSEKGYFMHAFVAKTSSGTEDFNTNLDRLDPALYTVLEPDSERVETFDDYDIIVDALFGIGLSRPVDGWIGTLIKQINASLAEVISIDMPSGLFEGDNTTNEGFIVESDVTLTFQTPKLALLLPESSNWAKRIVVLDIGLDETFIEHVDSPYTYVLETDVLTISRERFDHKGHFGRVLIVAGSKGKMGASVLASKACLRSGAGLVTAHVPECGYVVLQTAVPEAMVVADSDADVISHVVPDEYDVLAIGPGIGKADQTQAALKKLMDFGKPMVLDADALNILSENKDWLSKLSDKVVLTPHVKEFERLVGPCQSGFERLQKLRAFSKKYNTVVVLKGAHSATAVPNGTVYFNASGNPYMATGGSGDVLTGVIAALMAQGMNAADAAVSGVYLHGKAGDIAHEDRGVLIASDIINAL